MTPKEKAEELFKKYRIIMFPIICNKNIYHGESLFSDDMAKKCALIAVDEILDELDLIREITCSSFVLELIEYWLQVKNEIIKL